MQLIIENKTEICQLVWLLSIVCPSQEEVILLKGYEKKYIHKRLASLEYMTVWDRRPAFRLCHLYDRLGYQHRNAL